MSERKADTAISRFRLTPVWAKGYWPVPQDCLIAIFFSGFAASGVFGSVTVSTPFWKVAAILSASTPLGTRNERWKEPYRRSET